MSQAPEYDVAVVGYGPSGVTAANFLGHYGIRTFVVEREKEIYPRARAVTVDDFTLRLYQWVGLDKVLKADMDTRTILRWKTYKGREFLRVWPRNSHYSQPPSSMIYQPVMEATLRRGVDRFSKHIEINYGEKLVGIEQDEDGVTLETAAAGSDKRRKVRARYVMACDGGSSTIRGLLNIGLTGMSLKETWVIVDTKVKRWWPEQDILTFWSDRKRPAVDIPLALGHHRWEVPLRHGERKEDFQSKEALWKILTPIGVKPENIEILRHAFYEHHVLRAEHWRRGRVFLIGDAAHMMPPWAGQGMQSGIRDAQNVAWKLASVIRGELPDGVLDSYQVEREPHVIELTQLSRGMGWIIGARNPLTVALRNNGLALLQSLPVIGRSISEFGFKPLPAIKGGFLSGKPAKRNALGRMIPQPEVVRTNGQYQLLDDAIGNGFVVIGRDVDPRSVMSAADQAAWERLGATFFILRSFKQPPVLDTDLIDYLDILCPWLERYRARVIVLRPDKFVIAADNVSLSVPKVEN